MRETAHVAGALDVVLTPQRVHADALAPDIAGCHGQIGDGHNRGTALAMLGDAETIVDRAVATRRVETCSGAYLVRPHPGQRLDGFRRAGRFRYEHRPVSELVPVAPLADEGFVVQFLGYDHMRESGQHRDVGARPQRQMMLRHDMRRLDQISPARIDHDQLRALTQPLLHAAGEDRMSVGRIGADDEDDISLHHAVEVLRARRRAKGLAEAVPSRRMANARAGIDIVIAETLSDQLLNKESLFIGASAGRNSADAARSVFGLDATELGRGVSNCLLPRHFAPGFVH